MTEDLQKGLEGVMVTESGLSRIDGDAGELVYRGYAIEDLAHEASFEEVLHLLWYGYLPDEGELASFTDAMVAERAVGDEVLATVRELADRDENPMVALRTAVSMLSAYDPDADAPIQNTEAALRKGRRITAKIPTVLAAFARLRNGEEPVAPREDLGHAANFLYMLNGEEPDDVLAETFDMALVVHADHGINASTFSAMVTVSTLADLHSAVVSAIGTLKGPLHGGANQDVMAMLQEVDRGDTNPVTWVKDALEEGRRIPGFGHRVYNVKDPRAEILGERSRELGETAGELHWYQYSRAIEEYMAKHTGLAPNVDFFSGSTYYQMGIPVDIYTPIFAMSRVSGWIAHAIEYVEDNRLIRPRARYTGPENQQFVPLDER
ncbi:MAG: citrate synthase [Haloarculaceae archaeon]